MRCVLLISVLALACNAVAVEQCRSPDAKITGGVGYVEFPNSGAPAAQADFIRGVLLLHSFEYAQARAAFVEASRKDPRFALAYWGEALTHNTSPEINTVSERKGMSFDGNRCCV